MIEVKMDAGHLLALMEGRDVKIRVSWFDDATVRRQEDDVRIVPPLAAKDAAVFLGFGEGGGWK